jgi:hypothetical protein
MYCYLLPEDNRQAHRTSPRKDQPARWRVQPVGGEGANVRAGDDGRADPRPHVRQGRQSTRSPLRSSYFGRKASYTSTTRPTA